MNVEGLEAKSDQYLLNDPFATRTLGAKIARTVHLRHHGDGPISDSCQQIIVSLGFTLWYCRIFLQGFDPATSGEVRL